MGSSEVIRWGPQCEQCSMLHSSGLGVGDPEVVRRLKDRVLAQIRTVGVLEEGWAGSRRGCLSLWQKPRFPCSTFRSDPAPHTHTCTLHDSRKRLDQPVKSVAELDRPCFEVRQP